MVQNLVFLLCYVLAMILILVSGAIATVRASFGAGIGEIWLDNVNCAGTEPRLLNCPANPIGNHNCGHFEDAGVRCQEITTTPGELGVIQCCIVPTCSWKFQI